MSNARAEAVAGGVARWTGVGSQVYACQSAGDRFAWTLERPEAVLSDAGGQVRAQHGAGPSWTAADGSRIVGTVVASVPSPVPGAIPWLVLRVSQHAGSGVLDGVGYVLRTDTQGGAAAAQGCDAARVGAEARVPYRATYTFLFGQGDDARPHAP